MQCISIMVHTLLSVLFLIPGSYGGPFEEKLISFLLDANRYHPLSRPVANESEPAEVKFGLHLQQINKLEEKNELFHTTLWLNYIWTDYKLKWDPEEYGGVQSVRLPPRSVWTPDILLYNSADESIDSKFATNVVIYHTGMVHWVPLGIYISSCAVNIRWFPFDEQTCRLKFGSWTYDSSKINLTLRSDVIDISTYVDNGEWALEEYSAKRNVHKYECCPEEYPDITFTIRVRRRSLYHGINLIVPCVLVSILGTMTFILPPQSGEKITLSVTVQLQLGVLALIVSSIVPSTSTTVPLIGVYFIGVLIMCTSGVVLSVIALNLHYSRLHMPSTIRRIVCDWLPWLLRMPVPAAYKSLRKTEWPTTKHVIARKTSDFHEISNLIVVEDDTLNNNNNNTNNNKLSSNPWPTDRSYVNNKHHYSEHRPPAPVLVSEKVKVNDTIPYADDDDAESEYCYSSVEIGKQVAAMLEEMRALRRQLDERQAAAAAAAAEELEEARKIEQEEDAVATAEEDANSVAWKFASSVIDRMCFIICSIFLCSFTTFIFLSAPYVWA